MKKYLIFGVTCLVLLLIFIFGRSYYKNKQIEKLGFTARENASTFIRDYSQTKGSDDAKVYLIKFTDPGCETCAAFDPYIKQIMGAYPGKIKLVIRYAPFHKGSDTMVRILEASRKQGKFWETLDIMYKSQIYWASHSNPQPERIWEFLPKTGLDLDKVKKDMNDPAIIAILKQDIADGKTLNVRKTPGFFVNGKALQNFGYKQLLQLVQAEIRAKYPE